MPLVAPATLLVPPLLVPPPVACVLDVVPPWLAVVSTVPVVPAAFEVGGGTKQPP